jgi:hypothetical protein
MPVRVPRERPNADSDGPGSPGGYPNGSSTLGSSPDRDSDPLVMALLTRRLPLQPPANADAANATNAAASRTPTLANAASRTPTLANAAASRTPTLANAAASRTPTLANAASRTPTLANAAASRTPTLAVGLPAPAAVRPTRGGCAATAACLGLAAAPVGALASRALAFGAPQQRGWKAHRRWGAAVGAMGAVGSLVRCVWAV